MSVQPCPGAKFRRVEPGDTLYLIALETGTTVEDLVRLNPTVDPLNLEVGSVICVPLDEGLPTGAVPPCETGFYWVVSPGETLYLIAQSLGTTLDILLALNPSADPANLRSGDSLCIPAPPEE